MKKIIIYPLLVLIGCAAPFSRDNQVKENAENKLKEMLHDYKSYEFVSLELIDSTLFIDNINYRINQFKNRADDADKDVLNKEDYKVRFSMYTDEDIQEVKEEAQQNKDIIAEILKMKDSMGEKVNDVASLKYLLKFRANNAFGATMLHEYFLQTDSELNIINMGDEAGKIYVTPNEFPGYFEMINKISSK
jgi:hypothetical protein